MCSLALLLVAHALGRPQELQLQPKPLTGAIQAANHPSGSSAAAAAATSIMATVALWETAHTHNCAILDSSTGGNQAAASQQPTAHTSSSSSRAKGLDLAALMAALAPFAGRPGSPITHEFPQLLSTWARLVYGELAGTPPHNVQVNG